MGNIRNTLIYPGVMVHRKTTRWKWHACVQARRQLIPVSDDDSEGDHREIGERTRQLGWNTDDDDDRAASTPDSIFITEQKLKDEARLALAVSAQMARMQVEIERRLIERKKSSLYDLMGIETTRPFTAAKLEEMNLGQLHVLVNDLHYRIEANNDELVHHLIDRDSLSMEQDSILVDIDDLKNRLQERAAKPSTTTTPPCVYIIQHRKDTFLRAILRKAMLIR